jgi:DNA-binding transcriptional regulator YdaS (Cro superfamily)
MSDQVQPHDDPQPTDEPSAIEVAIMALGEGGQVLLAERCNVTPQAVNQWVKKKRVPPERVIDVETATGVSRHVLRPDVFGPPPRAAA